MADEQQEQQHVTDPKERRRKGDPDEYLERLQQAAEDHRAWVRQQFIRLDELTPEEREAVLWLISDFPKEELEALEKQREARRRTSARDEMEDTYIDATGDYDPEHHYTSRVILTTRSGEPFSDGDSPLARGLAAIANFSYAVNGDPTTPYEAAPVKRQVPTIRNLGGRFICMRCRLGSADWERLPRIGFDAPLANCDLTPEQLAARPPEARESVTVRDVLLSDAGRRWWHTIGPIYPIVYFDTTARSEACQILAQLPKEDGSMAVLEPDEWQHPIPRPRISAQRREAEVARLLHWSALWHARLCEVYDQAEDDLASDRIQKIGDDLQQDDDARGDRDITDKDAGSGPAEE